MHWYEHEYYMSDGLAGTRTQGLRLAKAAIFQLIYEPFLVVSYGPRIFLFIGLTVFRFPIDRNSIRLYAALGGDPAADSPTATLLRLNPTREA